jgi:hypothetical protein
MTVNGGWNKSAGTFTHNDGTVEFAGDALIQGSTTFYNFTHTTVNKTITFTAGTTQTVSGTMTVTGTNGNPITLTSNNTSTYALSLAATPSISYTNISYLAASGAGTPFCATYTTSTSGNNSGFTLSETGSCVVGITISGHVYSNEAKSANVGAGQTVSVSVNGAAVANSDDTDADGAFSITDVVVTDNAPLAIFVDEAAIEANLFTIAVDNSTNITGLELYTNKIVVQSETASAITNANIKTGLSCGNCGSNLHFTNPTGSKINYDEGYELFIPTGESYTPGAEIGTVGDIDINGTFNLEANYLTVTGSWDSTGGTFSQSGSTVNFTNTSGSQTITSAVEEFGNVSFSNGGTRTIADQMVINGTFTQTGGALDTNTYDPNITIKSHVTLSSGTIDKGSGTVTMAGDLNYLAAPGMNPGNVAIGASPDTITLTSDATYDSLTINLGDVLVTAGYNVTINGDFINNGTLDASTAGGRNSTITVSGNWDNNGTFTASTSTVVFTATDSGNTISDGGADWNHLTFNGSGGEWSIDDATIVGGDLTVTAGTLNGTNNITVNGGDVTGNGTINLTGGTFLLDATGNFGGNTAWTFSTLTFGDGTGSATSTKIGSGNITVSARLNIAANQTLNAGDDTWILSGTGQTTSRPFQVTGTFTPSTSTIKYTGNATSDVEATTYANLTIDSTGVTFYPSDNFTITNVFNITNGTFDCSNKMITLSGTGTPLVIGGTFAKGTGTIKYTGNGATNITPATYNHLEIKPAGSVTHTLGTAGSQTITVDGNLTIGDGTNAGTIDGDTQDPTLDLNGDITIAANAIFEAPSITMTVAKSWTNAGTFNHNNGTVKFDGGVASQTITNGGATNYDLEIAGTAADWTLQDSLTVSNTLTVTSGTLTSAANAISVSAYSQSGGTFTGPTGANNLDVDGNVALTGGAFTAPASGAFTIGGNFSNDSATFTHNSGTVTFDAGTTGKTITNGGTDFNNVVFNNASGGWIVQDGMTISGNLTVTNSDTSGNGVNLNNQAIDVEGNIALNGGKVTAGSSLVNIAGNWSKAATATFTVNTSTVIFDRTSGTQTITGDTTFNNLTTDTTAARTIQFAAESLTTVSGTWHATGASGQLLTLASSTTDAWMINPSAWTVSYVSVSYSINQAGSPINPTSSTDGGHNTNWFSATPNISVTLGNTKTWTSAADLANFTLSSTQITGDSLELTSDNANTFVTKWGASGTGDGQFNTPQSVAVDSAGNVYVIDSANNRIEKFNSSGSFVTKWGTLGTGNGQFNKPWGIAVDASDNIYVTDFNNNRVQKFNSSGSFISKFGTYGKGNGQLYNPTGIDLDSAGNIYVAEYSNHRVSKFTSAGAYSTKWGGNGTANGKFKNPGDLTVDSGNNIYVADTGNNRIQKFDSSGVYTTKWGVFGTENSQFNAPVGIDVDSGNNLYVADTGNNRIQKFNSSGTYLSKWGSVGTGDGQFSTPGGIGLSPGNYVYVADTANNRIEEFSQVATGAALHNGYNSGIADSAWYTLNWATTSLPAGASVKGKLRASNTYPIPSETTWSDFVTIAGGEIHLPSSSTHPTGQYAEIQFVLTANNGAANGPVVDYFQVSSFASAINENAGSTALTATLSGTSASDIDAYLGYAGSAVNGLDYSAATKITVPAGSLSASITLTSINDVTPESNENIIISIKGVSGGAESGTQEISTILVDNDYTITASAGSNGSIDPTGSVNVDGATDQAFTIAPDAGYEIDTVTVDSVAVGAVASYTFYNVTANHTISATFKVQVLTITVTSSNFGSISPAGLTHTVNYGASKEFTFTADANYEVGDVLVDGVSQGSLASYEFTTVTTDHTLHVEFVQSNFVINSSAGANGSITPNGDTAVASGGSQSYTITADEHYHVLDVLVDGESAGAVSTYDFTNVTDIHTIAVTFEIDNYTVTSSAGSNGSISPSGENQFDYNTSPEFTITPDSGYYVASIVIDSTSPILTDLTSPEPYVYTFSNISAAHTIAVTFATDNTCIWDGEGADADWNTASNWTGNVKPTAACDVVFNGTSTDASTVDAVFSNHVKSLSINAGYTNTITLANDLNIDGDVTLAAGTLDGGASHFTLLVGGSWTNTGTTFASNKPSANFNGSAAGKTITLNSQSLYDLTISGATGSWTLQDAATITNNLTVSGGTLIAGNNNITTGNVILSGGTFSSVTPANSKKLVVNGGWNSSGGGLFTHNDGTVEFAGDALIEGDTTFYNFTATTAGKTFTFAADSTQTVAGTWTVTGSAGNNIVLQRQGEAGVWHINPTAYNQASPTVDYVTVSNSTNDNSGQMINPAHYTNSGGNTNWFVYSITIAADGTGAGSFDKTSPQSVNQGGSLSVTATADTGSAFTSWSGCDTTSGDNNETCNLTDLQTDKTITATFTLGTDPVNDSLTFTNAFSGSTAVADDTTVWNFRALVTDTDGSDNLDYVDLLLANSADNAAPYDSLKIRWTRSSDTFSETADTQSAATLISASGDSNASGDQWTLDFKIKFNDNFLAKSTLYAASLYTIDNTGRTDSDNYADFYQVDALSLSIDISNADIDFGTLTPGSPIKATNNITITTNYPNGYSLAVSDGVAGSDSALLHTDTTTRIADYAGTITTPTLWTGTGLGLCLFSSASKDAKWGTGTTYDDANNKYAGIPENATTILTKTGATASGDQSGLSYQIDVPNTKKTGAYAGAITVTVTGNLN